MNNKKIGIFIAALRKEHKMTQKELADKLGVTNKAISKWETGEGYPEITIVPELARELNISVDELLQGTKHVNDKPIDGNLSGFDTNYIISLVLTLVGALSFILFTVLWQNIVAVGFCILLISVMTAFILLIKSFNSIKHNIANIFRLMPSDIARKVSIRIRKHFIIATTIVIMTVVCSTILTISLAVKNTRNEHLFNRQVLPMLLFAALILIPIIVTVLNKKVSLLHQTKHDYNN